MPRVCFFTGKRTISGRSIARRGKAKYLGGVGRKITGVTNRKFRPNLQKVHAVVDGRACRIRVSAKAIRTGLVQKRPKRNYSSAAPPQTQSGADQSAKENPEVKS
jgi:large subunit ribosomal protein L28